MLANELERLGRGGSAGRARADGTADDVTCVLPNAVGVAIGVTGFSGLGALTPPQATARIEPTANTRQRACVPPPASGPEFIAHA